MSRTTIKKSNNIFIYTGDDHAIGRFLDVIDLRFAGHETDEGGEGFVFEWSDMFGITTNLIGANEAELNDIDALVAKTEKFIQLNIKS